MAFQKSPETIREEAETRLGLKQAKVEEARRAFNEYEAAARAVDANTARLRALRLAKEAADAAASEPQPKAERKRKASKP